MSHGIKQDELKRRAQLAFREETLAHRRERPLMEEEVRHEDMLAKTKGLRELRLARETTQREASEAATRLKG
jgi:hypothetical protein